MEEKVLETIKKYNLIVDGLLEGKKLVTISEGLE